MLKNNLLEKTWSNLQDEFKKQYFIDLYSWVENEYNNNIIYPKKENIFRALELTSFKDIKVVILGQDPYNNPAYATGLAFSVNVNEKIPKSLQNIYKELNSDLNCYIPNNGNLTKWAKQGVLLLNTILTVGEKPETHKNKGWEILTDKIISLINEKEEPVVFILWGNKAKSKKELITNPNHLIIESVHPSPLSASRGFFGSKPFSKVNEFLVKNNIKTIDWQIENI